MVTLGLVILMWVAFIWERSTGLTFATRSRIGSVSTPARLAETRQRTVATTIFAFPVIVWAGLKMRE